MNIDGYEIPEAGGDPAPVWPLATAARTVSQDFGKPRAEGKRIHIAEDLPAPENTVVLAPESGEVLNVHEFTSGPPYKADTEVMLMATDTGLTIALGEIKPGSWAEYGIVAGSRVRKGHPIARVGGLEMLHLEIYEGRRKTTSPWWHGKPPPTGLLDPTEYLRRAAASKPGILPYAPVPPLPSARPIETSESGGGIGIVGALILLAILMDVSRGKL